MSEESIPISEGSIVSLPRQGKVGRYHVDPLSSNFPTWSSTYRNIQAYICYLISYISVMKFCDSVSKHGVFMFLPYMVFAVSLGFPAVLMEVMVGRFTMMNVFEAWKMCPAGKGLFYCLFVGSCFVLVLNYVACIYLLKYFIYSWGSHLPWESCDHEWAKENCFVRGEKSVAYAACLKNNSVEYCDAMKWESSGFQFWEYHIRNGTTFLNIFLSVLFASIAIFCSTIVILKGIPTLEKLLNLLMYPWIILWLIILCVSLRSNSASTGFIHLVSFDHWEQIVNPRIWVSGFEDTICFLGLATLALSCISSHGKFTDNFLIDVLIINCCGPVMCCLVATPILCIMVTLESRDGSGAREMFEDVANVFTFTSEAFLFFPHPKPLWCVLYYFYCFSTTYASQVMLLLAICEGVEGHLKKTGKRFYIILVISAVSLALSVGLCYIKEAMENMRLSAVLGMNILLYTITYQFFYGIHKFNSDYYFMMGYPVPIVIKITWISVLVVTPIGLTLEPIFKGKHSEISWIIFYAITFFTYFSTLIFTIIKYRIRKRNCSEIFMPDPDWGPDNPMLRRNRHMFEKSTVTKEIMYRKELHEKPHMKPPYFRDQNIVQLIRESQVQ